MDTMDTMDTAFLNYKMTDLLPVLPASGAGRGHTSRPAPPAEATIEKESLVPTDVFKWDVLQPSTGGDAAGDDLDRLLFELDQPPPITTENLGDLGDLGDLSDLSSLGDLNDLGDLAFLPCDDTPTPPKAKRARTAKKKKVSAGCNCSSGCSRLYCACFRAGVACNPETCGRCTKLGNCCNKVDAPGPRAARKSFCNCKKNGCKANYCECKLAGRTCGPMCGCPVGCGNCRDGGVRV